MLRLPKCAVETPATVEEAIALLAEDDVQSRPIAGGTDLLPNMKHELFTPDRLVALGGIAELAGTRVEGDGTLVIGATTTIDAVARDPEVARRAPSLAQATALIAGPQLRTMGTLGGNVLLDTRCQWYNQTYFWRQALGFCLKKDGTVCHVVEGGRKCVAAASNDSVPPLMTLDAELEIAGPRGRRTVAINDFWKADGIWNRKLNTNELLVAIRIPPVPGLGSNGSGASHHGAYGKLRTRGSIDFPLLGVAARVDSDGAGIVTRADLVVTALAARPVRVRSAGDELPGTRLDSPAFDAAVEAVAAAAHKQCRPMPNVPGDSEWRHEMVPVYVRQTLLRCRTP